MSVSSALHIFLEVFSRHTYVRCPSTIARHAGNKLSCSDVDRVTGVSCPECQHREKYHMISCDPSGACGTHPLDELLLVRMNCRQLLFRCIHNPRNFFPTGASLVAGGGGASCDTIRQRENTKSLPWERLVDCYCSSTYHIWCDHGTPCTKEPRNGRDETPRKRNESHKHKSQLKR